MSQKERENFYRHSILIVDYTKDGLTDLIEIKVCNTHLSFEDFINKNQHEIYHLCYNRGRCCQCTPGYALPQNRILYPSQLELLFNKHGSTLPCHNTGRRAEFCCCKAKSRLTVTVLDVTLARCILINFCRHVFWNSCLTKIGVTLEDFLNTNKHDLYHFFVGNQPCCQCTPGYVFPVHQTSIIQKDWTLLFGAPHVPCANHATPSAGAGYVCSVSATIGISVNRLNPNLSSIILEHFCPLRQAVDTLVHSRNSVYGHANEAKISDSDFTTLWSKTEKALLEISITSLKERETKQKLDDLQKRCLDETLLEQYKVKILEQIQMESDIQEDMAQQTEEIKMMKETIKNLDLKSQKILQLITEDQEIKRKKIKEYTEARIRVHVNDETYVATHADKIAMKSIRDTSMVVIVGPPGVGKSRMGLDLMRQYSQQYNNYHCLQIDNIMEWKDIVNVDDTCIILCDDIFGKTNCNYNEDHHSKIIDTIHTYVKSFNVKLIVTMRDSIKRACEHLFSRHMLFKDTTFLNIGAEYKMSDDEKQNCLIKHLRKNLIVVETDLSQENPSLESKTEFFHTKTIDEIISLKPNNILGFPETCFLFASNRKYLKIGADFFRRGNEILCQTISDLRKRGESYRQCMVDYTILVYVLVNGDTIDLNKINIENLTEVCLTTYPVAQNNLTIYEVEDSIIRLCGQMLQEIKPGIYSFQHRATFEAVLLSYRHFDQSKLIKLMDYNFILEFTRPDGYKGLDGEVFVNIYKNHYEELANQLLSQVPVNTLYYYCYVKEIVSSKICRLAGVDFVKEMCDKHNHFKNKLGLFFIDMNTFNSYCFAKYFDLSVAILLYTNDNNIVQYLLKIIHRKLSSKKFIFLKDLLSLLFILLCHTKSDKKAREVWKLIKSYKIYITDECFIYPVGWTLVVEDLSACKLMCSIVDHKSLDLVEIMNIACCLGEVESVKLLLETFDHNMFDVPEALNHACNSGKVELVKLLLDTFDHSLFDVKWAMNNAFKSREVELVKLLSETFDHSMFDVKWAMNYACNCGNVELVKLLIETFDHK